MSNNSIPTEDDWNGYKFNMDQRYAYEHYFGRSNENMQHEYAQNITMRVADLSYMPPKAFMYYVIGLRDFVLGLDGNECDAPDAAYGFITLIEGKLRDNPDHILPIMNDLINSVEFIACNQTKFRADLYIYGDFKDRLFNIKKMLDAEHKGDGVSA